MKFLHVSWFRDNTLGISDGLGEVGETLTFDWQTWVETTSRMEMNDRLFSLALDYEPDLIFIEETWTGAVEPRTIWNIKNEIDTVVVNWNGDHTECFLKTTLAMGEVADWVLVSNKEKARAYGEQGVNSAFLAAGCCPDVYRPVKPDRDAYPADIVFLGSPGGPWPNGGLRDEMARTLYDVYGDRFRVYGRGWDDGMPFVYPFLEPSAREAEAYSSCKIALGISATTEEGYTSARMWKAMGSGAFYLCHRFPGLNEWFDEGEHVVSWESISELTTKIDHYLSHGEERERIAKAGCAEVRENHTWEARIGELLDLVGLS